MRRKGVPWCAFALALLLAVPVSHADISPTTGLETDQPYRPMLVQYSNGEGARPLWGVSQADIVYEMIYWAPGYTRYQAVFNDEHAAQAGPVRGTRVYNVSLQMAWDAPFAHRGGQDSPGTSIYDFFKEQGIPETMHPDYIRKGRGNSFYTDKVRNVSPHNLYFNVAEWVREFWPEDEKTGEPYAPGGPGLRFSSTPSTGDMAVDTIALRYMPDGECHPVFTYDGATHLWLRDYDGVPEIDGITGRQIAVANVIVQAQPLSFHEGNRMRPVMDMLGQGPFTAYIDGTMLTGQWTREGHNDPFTYRLEDGGDLTLRPGQTFIQVVPPAMYETASEGPKEGAVTYDNKAMIDAMPKE